MVVRAGSPRELQELLRRDDKALFVESAIVRDPGHNHKVGRRRGPKARDVDVNRPVRVHGVDAHRLDLQPDHMTAVQLPHRELNGFEVRKRSE